jgi:hypothetical protein
MSGASKFISHDLTLVQILKNNSEIKKMRIPFHTLHSIPKQICGSPACFSQILDEPILQKVPLTDELGIQYAFDIQLTQGFYFLIVAYFLLSFTRDQIIQAFKKK